MSGMRDGVSKLWILRTPRGSLDLNGFDGEISAISQLIREAMVRDSSEENKAAIRHYVEVSLKHMDDDVQDESDEDIDETGGAA